MRTLVVQPARDGCAVTDAVETTYTRIGLVEPAAGGLVARAGGAEGDVTVPAS